jgi:acetylglutamate kinase
MNTPAEPGALTPGSVPGALTPGSVPGTLTPPSAIVAAGSPPEAVPADRPAPAGRSAVPARPPAAAVPPAGPASAAGPAAIRLPRPAVPARGHAALSKAAVLVEALPWLSRFHGCTVVIKYGGNAMTDPGLRAAFAADVVFLRYAGIRVVVVHGGGPQITAHLDRLGVVSQFAAGLRVTTPETMEVVRMVLVGQINRDVVGLVNDHGPFAVGLSGEDANLFVARRRTAQVDGREVDLGLVGDVVKVRPAPVEALLDAGKVPVVATVARGEEGGVYNVNADLAAAALAAALGAAKLVVLTNVEGLYADWPAGARTGAKDSPAGGDPPGPPDPPEVISELADDELERMIPTLSAGMIPKMEACLQAVRGGVPQAHVLDGRVAHAVLLEVFTDDGIGTLIVPASGGGSGGGGGGVAGASGTLGGRR